MAAAPLYILLCSGEHEKIQMAAMIASVAAVSDRPVRVFVSMNAILAFEKNKPAAERYHGGEFSRLIQENKVPDAIELFGQGKMLGDMTMHACSMVMDLKKWELDHLADDLFDGMLGLTKFLADAEDGELMTL
jgi:peroxiredoxin family protein